MTNLQPIVHLVSDDEAKNEAKEIFEKVKAATWSVPKWMRVMANCEDTLHWFFILFKSLMDNEPTDLLLKWKIAYIVSEENKCEFCVSVSKMQLKNLWIDKKTVKEIETISDDKEKVAIDYAKAVTHHAYRIDQNLINKLKTYYSDAQIVEITSVVWLFSFINRFNDALKVFPDSK